jgi:hypothetical protein
MEKTTSRPSKASRLRLEPQSAPLLPAVPPPRRLLEIPGLGPIRVRALLKAGFTTPAALRAADLNTLCAVPGLSEIKARQVLDFLAQFPTLPDSEPEPEPKSLPATDSVQDLRVAAAQTMGRIVSLMAAGAENGLRPKLLRELARLAERAEAHITEVERLLPGEWERAERRLRQASALLASAASQAELDRKAQARLADELAALTNKLSSEQ